MPETIKVHDWLHFDAQEARKRRAEAVCTECHSKKVKCDLQVSPVINSSHARLLRNRLTIMRINMFSNVQLMAKRTAPTVKHQKRSATCALPDAESAVWCRRRSVRTGL